MLRTLRSDGRTEKPGNGLGSSAETEFLSDVVDVGFDGASRDEQLSPDFGVAQPLGGEAIGDGGANVLARTVKRRIEVDDELFWHVAAAACAERFGRASEP